jgi:uncharacterized cupredoxin-like copper-binding protein
LAHNLGVADAPRHVSRAPVYVTLAFFAVALTLVLIGAQRSIEVPPPPAPGTPGTASAPRPVTVIMRDYIFDPREIVLIRGEVVRFAIFDAGLEPHEFTIGDATVQAAWEAADMVATPPAPFATPPPASVPPGVGGLRVLLRPGESTTIDYTVPEQGSLALVCHLPGHLEKGMLAQVRLQARGSTGTASRYTAFLSPGGIDPTTVSARTPSPSVEE